MAEHRSQFTKAFTMLHSGRLLINLSTHVVGFGYSGWKLLLLIRRSLRVDLSLTAAEMLRGWIAAGGVLTIPFRCRRFTGEEQWNAHTSFACPVRLQSESETRIGPVMPWPTWTAPPPRGFPSNLWRLISWSLRFVAKRPLVAPPSYRNNDRVHV